MNIFFYDGDCAFCTGLAKKLESICENKDIQFISFRGKSETELKKIHPGLNYEVMQAQVQLVYKGIRFPGFFAIRKLAFFLKGYKYFAFLLYLPLVPFLGMFVLYYLKGRKN